MSQDLYQNQKDGQLVQLISYHGPEHALVKTQTGADRYVALADLLKYEAGKGRTNEQPSAPAKPGSADPDAMPAPVIPADARLNLNMATAESIAERIKGVGYSTAKRVLELRMSLPGEKFTNLEQLRQVKRVDWDEVFAADLVYVA